MSYTHFETTSYNYTDIIPEENGCDYIFTDTIGVHVPVSDQAYDKPDRKQFVFTNIDSIGIISMYGNNMITPARFRPSLLGYKTSELVNRLCGKTTKDYRGVFIVEYITIHHYSDTTRYMQNIRSYYEQVTSMMYNREQAKHIEKAVTEASVKGGSRSIRTITYIPQDELFKKQYVYEPMSGILICAGKVTHDVIHPNSLDYKGMSCDIHNINKNTIAVDIVDNNQSGAYYTKVGNKIIPIIPTKDLTKPNGVTITPHINGVRQDYYNCTLEEAASVLGIYRTEQECKIEGDINNRNLEDKLNLEKEKLKLENNKLELENNKIILEYRKIEEEKIKMKAERDFYKFKINSEIYKIELDLNINKNKYKIAGIEYEKKLIDESLIIHKYAMEMKLHQIKCVNERNKHMMDKEKHQIDMISKGIGLGSQLLKLF